MDYSTYHSYVAFDSDWGIFFRELFSDFYIPSLGHVLQFYETLLTLEL